MDGVRCLVFGGSGALGREVCARLHARGARVVFTFHSDRGTADRIVSACPGALARQADLSTAEGPIEAARFASRALGGLDAFVHCAGVGGGARRGDRPLEFPRIGELGAPEWDSVMAVNVRAAFLAVPEVVGAMPEGGGNIVLVGSIDGVKPVPAPAHYAASKGALGAMARVLAKELGPRRIRVNVVAPGVIDGGLSTALPAHHLQQYLKHCALGRLASPKEIAAVVVWLALDNTYLDAASVVADGGL